MPIIETTGEIVPKTPEEIEAMRRSGAITSGCLALLAGLTQTMEDGEYSPVELDLLANQFIEAHGGLAAFHGYSGFPGHICISVNHGVLHGIPNNLPLFAGDIVSFDVGTVLDGWYSDACITVPVGDWQELDDATIYLLRTNYASLQAGLKAAKVGAKTGVISAALQRTIEDAGCNVVAGYDGHGIGRNLHEDPEIPSYGKGNEGKKIPSGLVICIEPLATLGSGEAYTDEDGWTIFTEDHTPASHFEQMVAVTDAGVDILTPYEGIDLEFLLGAREL